MTRRGQNLLSPLFAGAVAALLAYTVAVGSADASTPAFILAAFVAGLLDVPYRERDWIAFDIPLLASAFVLLGPLAALLTMGASRVAAALRTRSPRGVGPLVVGRLATLAGAQALWWAVSTYTGGTLPTLAWAGLVSALLAASDWAVQEYWYRGDTAPHPLSHTASLGAEELLPMAGALISASMLATSIVPALHAWGVTLTLLLIVLIRQSYGMLLDIRAAYRGTVAALVDAAEEGSDLPGHSERTAVIARTIAQRSGITGQSLEQLTFAALLQDVDRLAGEGEAPDARTAGKVVAEMPFATGASRALLALDSARSGLPPTGSSNSDHLVAFLVALSSEIDLRQSGIAGRRSDADAAGILARVTPTEEVAKAIGVAVELGFPIPPIG